MGNNYEGMFKIIAGFIGAIATVLIWWISRLLSDKKDIITNAVNIENLKDEVKELKDEVKENRQAFEHYKDKQADNY